MRIVIGYPHFDEQGNYQIGQNRQAQRFEHGAFIFPVIPAYAATMLKQAGHEVHWMDGPAEGWNWVHYLFCLKQLKPDLIAWEVKTPTVKKVWPLVNQVKRHLPDCKVVLMGDHVTALPEESIENSEVDIVLMNGDYDFGLMEIVKNDSRTTDRGWISKWPKKQWILNFNTGGNLNRLPVIDRELTKWRLYSKNGSGNYKYLPATHTMIGRDCWWRHTPDINPADGNAYTQEEKKTMKGGCTFCVWDALYPNWRCGSPDQLMSEVENCYSLGMREIFDDTGTFPIGSWLHEFCDKLRKFNKGKRHGKAKITMGCNMRPGALKPDDWNAMASAGFRFILFGLESASQVTIDRINKGQKPGDIERSCRDATNAGLDPHATCMVGYPWETRAEAEKTIKLTQGLFRKGHIKTLQATIVIPYPGTELFRQCQKEGWLLTEDWNEYDMRKPVMKSPMTQEEVLRMTRGIYKSCITPSFIAKKIFSVRSPDDLKFLAKGARYMLGHLKDFGG